MISKIAAIGLVGVLTAALIGGSVYILLRPDHVVAAENARAYNRGDSLAGQQGTGHQGGRGDSSLPPRMGMSR
ncbi:MAG: hypothetical protein U9R72_10410 [Chloroflexota bacterium]|nr:hypothetical protein [Chloroflexota bacterium]